MFLKKVDQPNICAPLHYVVTVIMFRVSGDKTPSFIVNYFNQTGKNTIPNPRIKHTRQIGSSTEVCLV